MEQVNKKSVKDSNGSIHIAGDFFMQSLSELVLSNSVDGQKGKLTIHEFLLSVVAGEYIPELNGTFSNYFNLLLLSNEDKKLKSLIHLFSSISMRYSQFADLVVNVFIFCLSQPIPSDVCVIIIHELGQIGHSNESTCNKIIDEINKITHQYTDHEIIMESIHALYEIGLSWKKKKKIFFPLLDILKSGDKDQKLEAIRAIRTQLEGYWEKPIESLKDLVLYDEDFEVRRVAAMSLGEVGAYTSHSVREAIFELTANIANQIQRLKVSLKKQPLNNFHIKCRLSDNKAILKILYHYIRVHKYGFSQ